MYTGISAAFLPALRNGHTSYGYLEAWRGGSRLTVDDGLGNPTTRLPMEVTGSNEVPVDSATPGARRTLTATLTRTPGLWDAIEPIGTELRAFVVLRYPNGAVDTIPQGVFPIDVQKVSYAPGGILSITAPDRWKLIQDARFLTPRASTPGISVRTQIANLLLEALPAGTSVTDVATSTATMPPQTEPQDRAGWIQKMATAASLDVSFDRNGGPVIRDAPVLDPAHPVWTVDAGDDGVLIVADRQRDRQKTYNVVVVTSTQLDGTAPFDPVVCWDNDSTSQTYAGPGAGTGGLADLPAATLAGPFGQRPTFYSSPLLQDATQAAAAGATMLAQVLGRAAQLTLSSIPCAALDDGDTIRVVLPPERRYLPPTTEVHLVDGFTVPLIPSTNDMPISTRSTRPDAGG